MENDPRGVVYHPSLLFWRLVSLKLWFSWLFLGFLGMYEIGFDLWDLIDLESFWSVFLADFAAVIVYYWFPLQVWLISGYCWGFEDWNRVLDESGLQYRGIEFSWYRGLRGFLGQVSWETAVFDFLDTAVCVGFNIRSRKRPRYYKCCIPRSVPVFGLYYVD